MLQFGGLQFGRGLDDFLGCLLFTRRSSKGIIVYYWRFLDQIQVFVLGDVSMRFFAGGRGNKVFDMFFGVCVCLCSIRFGEFPFVRNAVHIPILMN